MILKTRAVCLHRLLKDFFDVQVMRLPAVQLPPALRDGNMVVINSHFIDGCGTSALVGRAGWNNNFKGFKRSISFKNSTYAII